jgi:hypothetical protein
MEVLSAEPAITKLGADVARQASSHVLPVFANEAVLGYLYLSACGSRSDAVMSPLDRVAKERETAAERASTRSSGSVIA